MQQTEYNYIEVKQWKKKQINGKQNKIYQSPIIITAMQQECLSPFCTNNWTIL